MATSRPELRLGSSLATAKARYRIKERINSGANGVVYRALAGAKTSVAIKLFSPRDPVDRDKHEVLRRAFLNESKKLRRARHWAVVRVLDTGFTAIGSKKVPFLAMEFAPHSLRKLISDDQLGAFAASFYAGVLCETIEYINAKGQIHRDIKPENVLVDNNGLLKIADLGIAEIVPDFEQLMIRDYSLYQETPDSRHPRHYFSPEQMLRAEGNASVGLTHSDVFQVGRVIHEMFTQVNPIGQLKAGTPASKDMPPVVHDCVLRMLADRSEDRPPLAPCAALFYDQAAAALVGAQKAATRLTRQLRQTFAQWFAMSDRFDPDTSPTPPDAILLPLVRAGLIRAVARPQPGLYDYVRLTRKGRDVRDLLLGRPSLGGLVDLYELLRRVPAPSEDLSRRVAVESLVFCEKRTNDWPAWVICPPFHLGNAWWIEVFEGNLPWSSNAVPSPRQWPVPYGAPRHIAQGSTLGGALKALSSTLQTEAVPIRRIQRAVREVRRLTEKTRQLTTA